VQFADVKLFTRRYTSGHVDLMAKAGYYYQRQKGWVKASKPDTSKPVY